MKRLASLIGALYCAAVCSVSYFSLYYDMKIEMKAVSCLAVSCISLVAIVIMLYSRKQVLTIISSLVMIPALLPIVLIYYGSWGIIIPAAIAALTVFFFSGLGETAKTVIGTIYLFLYILGSLAFFLASTIFSTSVQKEIINTDVSASGKYRYELVNTKDSSNGSTSVYVEPNDNDHNFGIINFTENAFDRSVFIERPADDNIKIEWKTEKREDITKQLLDISSEITINLSKEKKELIGLESEETVFLADITEKQFDILGIEKEGDVLYVNDKPCFRYYIAELEEYYRSSDRNINIFS